MTDIVWFRRGDGAEFAVHPGSDAEANLIAAGALHIDAPGTADAVAEVAVAPVPTKAQLLELAASLNLTIPAQASKAVIAEAIAAEEARLAAEPTKAAGVEGT